MKFNIGRHEVGEGCPTYIIAEIGINHNGDMDLASKMIKAAAESGVDAVKVQLFKADTFVSKKIKKAAYQEDTTDEAESLYDMWCRLEITDSGFSSLMKIAEECGVDFFTSAFDFASVDLAANAGVDCFKVASGDVTALPLLTAMAAKKKPILMSVGMANLAEIHQAVECLRENGSSEIALLQCTSQYPTLPENVNLEKIPALKEVFNLPVGFSDHSESPWAAVAAVAKGACIVERHFTLDKDLPGPDQKLSADPAEMKLIVDGIREIEKCLGSAAIEPAEVETEGRTLYRRSVIAIQDIAEGTVITDEMITLKRPASGIAPANLKDVVGKRAGRDIASEEAISWKDL